jgi:hypothetical protein
VPRNLTSAAISPVSTLNAPTSMARLWPTSFRRHEFDHLISRLKYPANRKPSHVNQSLQNLPHNKTTSKCERYW